LEYWFSLIDDVIGTNERNLAIRSCDGNIVHIEQIQVHDALNLMWDTDLIDKFFKEVEIIIVTFDFWSVRVNF
jgi:hypothetical protein